MYLRTSRTRVEHTSWQSSIREFGNTVEATDAIEEIQIRTITEITTNINTMKNVNANKKIDCKICHANFDNFEEFLVHKHLEHKIKPYVCNFCNAKFVLSAHLNIHKCDNYLRMAIPSTSFDQKPTTSKSSSEFHQCDLCEKSYKSQSALNGHMKFHCNRSKISRRQPPY